MGCPAPAGTRLKGTGAPGPVVRQTAPETAEQAASEETACRLKRRKEGMSRSSEKSEVHDHDSPDEGDGKDGKQHDVYLLSSGNRYGKRARVGVTQEKGSEQKGVHHHGGTDEGDGEENEHGWYLLLCLMAVF